MGRSGAAGTAAKAARLDVSQVVPWLNPSFGSARSSSVS
jgi:hypothetical protein